MAVPESKRGHGKFEVTVKAKELTAYTLQITSNEKTFDPKYFDALTADIIRTAKDIYIKCKTANDIWVAKDLNKAGERRRLQESAINDCNRLLALIDIAQPVFHLETRRIKYWGSKTIAVRDMIRRWKDNDSKHLRRLKDEAIKGM